MEQLRRCRKKNRHRVIVDIVKWHDGALLYEPGGEWHVVPECVHRCHAMVKCIDCSGSPICNQKTDGENCGHYGSSGRSALCSSRRFEFVGCGGTDRWIRRPTTDPPTDYTSRGHDGYDRRQPEQMNGADELGQNNDCSYGHDNLGQTTHGTGPIRQQAPPPSASRGAYRDEGDAKQQKPLYVSSERHNCVEPPIPAATGDRLLVPLTGCTETRPRRSSEIKMGARVPPDRAPSSQAHTNRALLASINSNAPGPVGLPERYRRQGRFVL